jgi:hypothetical protein
MAITNALIKAGQSALTKGTEKAIEKATQSAISKAVTDTANKAVTKAITRSLTGAGISSLSPKAGSTLDGILGRSSGLVLPETKIVPKSLYERSGGKYNTIGDAMSDLDYSLADIKSDKTLSKKNLDLLDKNTREIADINNSALDAVGATAKSNLPMLNRDQYYEETLGRVGKNGVMSADVPDYMQRHLSNPKDAGGAFARGSNDEILRDLFQDQTSPISELYDRYDKLASSGNANEIFTPENVDQAIELANYDNSGAGDAITQDFADRAFGNKRDIAVSGGSSPTKKVKVSRPTADMGVEETVAETPRTANPELANQIAELRAQIGSTGGSGAGMGNNGGGGTATQLPGSEGFNVKLKTGDTTNIRVAPEAVGSTRQQRAIRKLDDMTAKSMNASAKQYRGLVGKSGSIDGHYKTVAERMRAEKIDQANVAQKAQSALSLREDIKQQGLQYAEANGVTLNLAGIDNTIGLSATQKRKLAELGLGLDEMLGGNGTVTPTQAEDIYKTLRDYAYNWSDSKDALTKMAGNACEKEASAVRDMIDNTMDNINVDYKTPLLEEAAKNGEDPAYLRKLAGKSDFKFSDLRKDQSDWIAINDLAGNKIKNEPTLNIFGVDTGVNNPLSSGAERIKEKIYERQAYGAGGAGGNNAGGSVPPTGGSGAENNINFATVGGGRTGTLGNLLNRAKGAGLIGAGILGGMALGGGGGGSNSGSTDFTSMGYSPAMAEPEEEIDPYQTMTIGGYTYDDLEAGYIAALQAGDSDAAKLIANMMGMLDDKVDRYYTTKKNSSSGSSSSSSSNSGDIASKQKAALNVLSGLMQNYQSQGPIGGRFTQFMNALTGGGYAPGIAAYDSGAQGSLGTIIKALGDTGALSEGDQKRALELLPKTTDSEQAAKMKYQQLIQILQGAGAQ